MFNVFRKWLSTFIDPWSVFVLFKMFEHLLHLQLTSSGHITKHGMTIDTAKCSMWFKKFKACHTCRQIKYLTFKSFAPDHDGFIHRQGY